MEAIRWLANDRYKVYHNIKPTMLSMLSGVAIIMGNPHLYELREYLDLKARSRVRDFIFYLVVEGHIMDSFLEKIERFRDGIIVVPTNYVYDKLRRVGFKPDMVIHHGIERVERHKLKNTKSFCYIAGYLPRKYPHYGIEAIALAGVKPFVITTSDNPYMNYFNVVSDKEYSITHVPDSKVYDLYRNHSWYLNLSDTEGFGVTPLEAMGFGCVPIAPRIPPFLEILPDWILWVKLTGRVWYQNWGNWLWIEHFEYDVDDMVKRIKEALEMDDDEFEELSKRAVEHAKNFHFLKTYSKFVELLDELTQGSLYVGMKKYQVGDAPRIVISVSKSLVEKYRWHRVLSDLQAMGHIIYCHSGFTDAITLGLGNPEGLTVEERLKWIRGRHGDAKYFFVSDVNEISVDGWIYLEPDVMDQLLSWVRWKEKILLSVPPDKRKKVLDIGGGYGFARMYTDEYHYLDIEDKCLLCNDDKVFKYVQDFHELPFEDETFDTVILFDVLEHTTYYGKLIDEAKRVVKTDGFVLVHTINNKGSIVERDEGHVHCFTQTLLRRALERHGLKVLEIGVHSYANDLIYAIAVKEEEVKTYLTPHL